MFFPYFFFLFKVFTYFLNEKLYINFLKCVFEGVAITSKLVKSMTLYGTESHSRQISQKIINNMNCWSKIETSDDK